MAFFLFDTFVSVVLVVNCALNGNAKVIESFKPRRPPHQCFKFAVGMWMHTTKPHHHSWSARLHTVGERQGESERERERDRERERKTNKKDTEQQKTAQ